MYNPTKKVKYSFSQQNSNTIQRQYSSKLQEHPTKLTINQQIYMLETKIEHINSNILQINNSIDIKLNSIINELQSINKTQNKIKNELSGFKDCLGTYLSTISSNLEHIKVSCDILTQNQQRIADILFNGDSSMISSALPIPLNNSVANYYS